MNNFLPALLVILIVFAPPSGVYGQSAQLSNMVGDVEEFELALLDAEVAYFGEIHLEIGDQTTSLDFYHRSIVPFLLRSNYTVFGFEGLPLELARYNDCIAESEYAFTRRGKEGLTENQYLALFAGAGTSDSANDRPHDDLRLFRMLEVCHTIKRSGFAVKGTGATVTDVSINVDGELVMRPDHTIVLATARNALQFVIEQHKQGSGRLSLYGGARHNNLTPIGRGPGFDMISSIGGSLHRLLGGGRGFLAVDIIPEVKLDGIKSWDAPTAEQYDRILQSAQAQWRQAKSENLALVINTIEGEFADDEETTAARRLAHFVVFLPGPR